VKQPLRVALIGQKFMGRAHANAWGQVNRFFELPVQARLEIVAARDRKALTAFAPRWGVPRTTSDWREIVDDESIDLVDVATPNDLHAEPAIAMLEAGKHVACEKPLAGTLEDARAMAAAAGRVRRGGPRTFVWFNYRRVPAVGLAWDLVRAGRLGRIHHVRARYLQSWGGAETPSSWRFEKARAGSGAHGDLNAHLVDLARFLVGEELVEVHGAIERNFVASRPKADGRRGRKKSDVDDCVLFLASFSGGATASFEATRLAAGHHNDHAIEIEGERGSLRFSFEDMNALHFFDATEKRVTQGWRRIEATAAGAHPWVGSWWPEGHGLGYEHTFVNMAADVLRVLGGKKPEAPIPDFEDAFKTQRVLEAALLSARQGAAVALADVG
jgi:predicted dehydrogenase